MTIEILPQDIKRLPSYFVQSQLFICTSILLILLLVGSIAIAIVWIIRSCKNVYNYDYIPYHQFKVYRQKKIDEIKVDDEEVLNQEEGFTQSAESQYNPDKQNRYRGYNRLESRILEFICLSVPAVININAYSSKGFGLGIFAAALLFFFIFNLCRCGDTSKIPRMIFYILLAVVYVPFFIDHSLKEVQV